MLFFLLGIKMEKNIKKEFKNLRRTLLDLTSRNSLLNFKLDSKKSLEIVYSSPQHLYQTLILQNKKMNFSAGTKNKKNKKHSRISSVFEPLEPFIEPIRGFNKSLNTNASLETLFSPQELQKKLFYINQEAKTMIQEQGYNILYLAVGFLEWTDKYKPNEIKKAPLVLIPVILERKTVGKSFSIQWNGEEIKTNISLKAKLEEEEGLVLPDFQMKNYCEAIDHYFNEVNEKLSKKWNINKETALGFFSFRKFIMYNDLDPNNLENTNLTKNNLINAIFNPKPDKNQEYFNSDYIDKKLSYNDMYHVLDADSSQIAVIEDVKAGVNLVVEGPPGTGKSQTIVNLIAELMVSGKTVLFVSEKMAALEVVKNRLDSVGLGKFVLQLHSNKARRKQILKELEKDVNNRKNYDLSNVKRSIRRLESLRYELDEYLELVHRKNYSVNMSPFELYGMKEIANDHFSSIDKIIPLVEIKSPDNISKKDLDDIIIGLENLSDLYQSIGEENPWVTCSPKSLLPGDLREIQQVLSDLSYDLNNFSQVSTEINQNLGIKIAKNLNDYKKIKNTLDLLDSENIKLFDEDILNSELWFKEPEKGIDLIRKLEEYQSTKDIMDKFNNSIENQDLKTLIEDFNNENKHIFKFFKKNKPIKNNILSFYKQTNKNLTDKTILRDLKSVEKFTEIKNDIFSLKNEGEKFFGELWRLDADISQLKILVIWMDKFNQFLKEKIYSKTTIKTLSKNLSIDEDYDDEIKDYIESGDKLFSNLKKLISKLNPNIKLIFKKDCNDVPFKKWENQLNKWEENLATLHLWSQYLNTKNACLKTPASIFIKSIESKNLKKEDIKSLVYGNFADSLLKLIFAENKGLSSFIGELHENKIKDFRELDLKIIELNRKRVYHKLNENIPEIFGNADNEESKILAAEITRKKGQLPLRTLFEKSGGVIKQIKPCFMMSPLSIAQYLNPSNEKLKFDVVIFDEASQLKPEDAVGAFIRAETAVVIGDTQQLPPTSFFDKITDIESEEIATALDMESILHLCKLSFPVRMLKWHYRSRHESLINVSNKLFYDGQLIVYPSPSYNDEELGLKLKYNLENKYYPSNYEGIETGSVNPKQASEVVEEIFNHFKKHGETKSLGVGTFSVSQKNAILEELEIKRKEHPELEYLFSEEKEDRFFVKNLETIQGDERDVMLISIGYGFDESGKLSTNFGPLNQDGGERRLNVLLSRAKEKCIIFSNFKSYDMHLNSNAPFGVKALKEFLEYAENSSKGLIQQENISHDDFTDNVYNFLKEKGFELNKNVGFFEFKIDLAILDDKDSGKYILGIECDGTNYKSSKVARDRDRLRDQVLNGLHWNLYHLWSTDWYRNRDLAKSKLLKHIEKVKSNNSTNQTSHKNNNELKEDVKTENNFEDNEVNDENENEFENNEINDEFENEFKDNEINDENENEFKDIKTGNEFENNKINNEKKTVLEDDLNQNTSNNKSPKRKIKFRKSLKNIFNNSSNNNKLKKNINNNDSNLNEDNNKENINNNDSNLNEDNNKENINNNNSNLNEDNNKKNINNNDSDLNEDDNEENINNNNFNLNENDFNLEHTNEDIDLDLENIIKDFNLDNNEHNDTNSNLNNDNLEDDFESNEYNDHEDFEIHETLSDITNPLTKDSIINDPDYEDEEKGSIINLKRIKKDIEYLKKSLKAIENPPPSKKFTVIDGPGAVETDESNDNSFKENRSVNRRIDYKNLKNHDNLKDDNLKINDDTNNYNLDNNEKNDEFLEKTTERISKEYGKSDQRLKDIDDTKIPKKPKNMEKSIITYKYTEININKDFNEFYKSSDDELVKIINNIVLTEGPIHINDVILRIKENSNLTRATSKFKNKINEAIKNSEKKELIYIIDNFLFSTKEDNILVRKREKPNIDLISNEEIEENIKLVLIYNIKVKDTDLTKQVAKNFGFKSNSKKTSSKINYVIDYLIAQGNLINQNNILEWIN
jgi:superfamily I DNA and/or RNA helicase